MTTELSVVGIDIAKRIFHLVGTDDRGKVILRRRLGRGEVLSFMVQLVRSKYWNALFPDAYGLIYSFSTA